MATFKLVKRYKTYIDAPNLASAKAIIKQKISDRKIPDAMLLVGQRDDVKWEFGTDELTKVSG